MLYKAPVAGASKLHNRTAPDPQKICGTRHKNWGPRELGGRIAPLLPRAMHRARKTRAATHRKIDGRKTRPPFKPRLLPRSYAAELFPLPRRGRPCRVSWRASRLVLPSLSSRFPLPEPFGFRSPLESGLSQLRGAEKP